MNKILSDIIQFLLEPDITGWLLTIKIIFLVFTVIFLGFIVWALIFTTWLKRAFLWDLKEFLSFRPYGLRKFAKEWREIEKRLGSGVESEIKLALIEADSLLAQALKRLGYAAESLPETLAQLTADILPNIENINLAHKMRDDIIHDPSYKVNLNEAKKALAVYEKALINLDAL